jgi:hypothetical protein
VTAAPPPSLIALAGPNGAGKSTADPILLKETLGVTEFVNADLIAQGLSPFAPETTAVAAGRIMLARMRDGQLASPCDRRLPTLFAAVPGDQLVDGRNQLHRHLHDGFGVLEGRLVLGHGLLLALLLVVLKDSEDPLLVPARWKSALLLHLLLRRRRR